MHSPTDNEQVVDHAVEIILLTTTPAQRFEIAVQALAEVTGNMYNDAVQDALAAAGIKAPTDNESETR